MEVAASHGREMLCRLLEMKFTGIEVKATVFPVGMYGCESWTIKKAEH